MAGGGGAWKVAFADFVTAMMALFMVLWIMNQDEKIKGEVQRYFKTRYWSTTTESPTIIPTKHVDLVHSKKSIFDNASAVPLDQVRRLNEDLVKAFQQTPNIVDMKTMKIEMSDEGMRVNFFDNPDRPIFKDGSEEITEYGKLVFQTVAWNVARYSTTELELEGHTSSAFKPTEGRDAWDVSSRRALAARKQLVDGGVKDHQFKKIGGFAGTVPVKGRDPKDPQNARVTIMIRAGNNG